MMYSNPGFAIGTCIGATIQTKELPSGYIRDDERNLYEYKMLEDGYFIIAQARTIPNGETDPMLPTPTGFTKLNERIIVKGAESAYEKTTALGVYIKQCSANEVISASLAPDSRVTLTPVEVVTSNYPNPYIQLQDLSCYNTTTSCARFPLGINETNVYGFEIEYKPDSYSNSHGVILAGNAEGFRLIRTNNTTLQLYVRNTLVYSGAILNYSQWNTISLKENKLIVNGTEVQTVDTSTALGTNPTTVHIFGYGGGIDSWYDTSGTGSVRRVVLYTDYTNGTYTYLPTYNTSYSSTWYGMFNTTTSYFRVAEVNYRAYNSSYYYEEADYPISTSGPINNGIYGDIIGMPVYGAQRYEFDTSWNDLGTYTKDGRYASIYFALSDPTQGNIVKEGSDYCYYTRPGFIDGNNNWYNGEGLRGLIGGFSPDLSSGIKFNQKITNSSTYDNIVISFEVRFFDENSKQNETFGSIIRNGIRYTPDIKKLIPTYNGTFVNDFKVLYDYDYYDSFYNEPKHNTIEAIKFITPSAVSAINAYSYLNLNYLNVQFGGSQWNIYSDYHRKIGPTDYHNIILGGTILPEVNDYNEDLNIVSSVTGGSAYSNSHYANIILGEYNYAYGNYLNGRIILGRSNKSFANNDTHWIIGEANSIKTSDYSTCIGYGNKVSITYDDWSCIEGTHNVVIDADSDRGTDACYINGRNNVLFAHTGPQILFGCNNKLYDHKVVEMRYNYNGTIYTSSYDDDNGRSTLVSGGSNQIYGGASFCAGYNNRIYDDIGYNNTSTVLNFQPTNMLYWSRGTIGANNESTGVLFTIGDFNTAKSASIILGENNRCNTIDTYGEYVVPGGTVVSTEYLNRRAQIIGSSNQANGSGTIIGFANRANKIKAIFGSDNYVDLDTQSSVTSMIFGDRNRLITSPNSHIFGSLNDVSRYNSGSVNAGVQIYGSENNGTINYVIYGIHNYSGADVGFIYGSYNNLTATIESVYGSYNTIANSTISYAVVGDYNSVNGSCLTLIGNNNQMTGASNCLGSYNILESGASTIGFYNTAKSGSFAVGSNNNVNYGSYAFGVNNITNNQGGGYYLMGYSNTIAQNAGGSGPVFGYNNTVTGGMNSYGIIGHSNSVGPGATAVGSGNTVVDGSMAIGCGNNLRWGSTAIGLRNQTTGGGGHYIIGIENNATNTGTTIIGLGNTISAGLAIGKALINTDTNYYRTTIGQYNDPNVDIGTLVVFADGTGYAPHNLFYSTAEHDTYFSGHVYSTNVPDAPNTPGVYTLKCTVTVNDGNVVKTYEWINSNNESVNEIDVTNPRTFNKEKGIMELDDGALIGSTSVTVSSTAGTVTGGGKDTEITIPIKKQFDTVTEVTLS